MKRDFWLLLILIFTWNTATAQKRENPSYSSDFRMLCDQLERIHPDLYMYQSKDFFEQKKDSIVRIINDSMQVEQFYLTVAPFVASICDGHTNLLIYVGDARRAFLQKGGKTFPLRVSLDKRKIFVDFSLVENIDIHEKDEVLAINGTSTKTILDRMYNLLGAERGNAIKDAQLKPYFSTLLWYMYGESENFDIVIKRNRKEKTVHIPGITQEQFSLAMKGREEYPLLVYDLSINNDRKFGTLVIRSLYDTNKLSAYCDSVFPILKEQHITELTIDVRGNGGGSSASIDVLMKYLAHDDYRVYEHAYLKISPASKAHYEKRNPAFYQEIQNEPDGSLYRMTSNIISGTRDNLGVYNGKVTLLVDERTYSGASTLAAVFKKSNAGEVVGETGCPPIYMGDFIFGALPHSGIQYYISMKKFYEYGT